MAICTIFIVKRYRDVISLKLIFTFSVVPMKIPTRFFMDLKKNDSKIDVQE